MIKKTCTYARGDKQYKCKKKLQKIKNFDYLLPNSTVLVTTDFNQERSGELLQ